MAGKGVRITVVCEDQAHERFARRVFLGIGYSRRELYFRVSPSGRGAADKWVLDRYAEEVAKYRAKGTYQKVGVAVVIDADSNTVMQRHEAFSRKLSESGAEDRTSNDRIVIWVPRRHIETWVAWLTGEAVTEDQDCKRLVSSDDYGPASERFVSLYQQHTGDQDAPLPSISTALTEMKRLTP